MRSKIGKCKSARSPRAYKDEEKNILLQIFGSVLSKVLVKPADFGSRQLTYQKLAVLLFFYRHSKCIFSMRYYI